METCKEGYVQKASLGALFSFPMPSGHRLDYFPHPPLGSFLGDLTDEITKDYGDGAEITEFVCTAPKSYAMKVRLANGETATPSSVRVFG